MPEIIAFTKVALPYGWLGNMSPYPIELADQEWKTAEALFQSLRFEDDDPVREEIRAAASPMTAKMIAKSNKDKMVIEPCSGDDLSNMTIVLLLKINQHPDLKKQLIETGDAKLIEDVTSHNRTGNHTFWGMALTDGEWVGENMLGTLWMEIRKELKTRDS